MCGIAGYSVSPDSSVQRTLSAQALLAGIAERGADAVGYAHRGSDAAVSIHKRRSGASELLDEVRVPRDATQVLVHVRDYTKGHPTIESNNHPIRHGTVVGIHNGIIANDDEIFALAEHADGSSEALEELYGAMATAWLDERDAATLFLARGVGRPLWIGTAVKELFFASTRDALEVLERTLRLSLRKRSLDEGTLLRIEGGHVTAHERFQPDRSYVEDRVLPAIRAPHEGASCLQRLAAIALAAG